MATIRTDSTSCHRPQTYETLFLFGPGGWVGGAPTPVAINMQINTANLQAVLFKLDPANISALYPPDISVRCMGCTARFGGAVPGFSKQGQAKFC